MLEPTAPMADIISTSIGAIEYVGEEGETNADAVPSLGTDWVVYVSGSSFSVACGNAEGSLANVVAPSGAYNCLSVAAYDDHDSANRNQNSMWIDSLPGPTSDGRRKPDLCAPGYLIFTTEYCYDPSGEITEAPVSGTSFAQPHVAGVCALLLEARPSLIPQQIHAILVNSADFMETESQSDWAAQPGWGMLYALRAVQHRNYTVDGTLTDPDDVDVFDLSTIPAGAEVVVTGVWHRAMTDEDSPVEDVSSNPAPANLDLFLQKKESGGSWNEADTSEGVNDGNPEDNVRQVRAFQNASGQPQLLFRVKVKHNPTNDTPYEGSQTFTLASRHAFN